MHTIIRSVLSSMKSRFSERDELILLRMSSRGLSLSHLDWNPSISLSASSVFILLFLTPTLITIFNCLDTNTGFSLYSVQDMFFLFFIFFEKFQPYRKPEGIGQWTPVYPSPRFDHLTFCHIWISLPSVSLVFIFFMYYLKVSHRQHDIYS